MTTFVNVPKRLERQSNAARDRVRSLERMKGNLAYIRSEVDTIISRGNLGGSGIYSRLRGIQSQIDRTVKSVDACLFGWRQRVKDLDLEFMRRMG